LRFFHDFQKYHDNYKQVSIDLRTQSPGQELLTVPERGFLNLIVFNWVLNDWVFSIKAFSTRPFILDLVVLKSGILRTSNLNLIVLHPCTLDLYFLNQVVFDLSVLNPIENAWIKNYQVAPWMRMTGPRTTRSRID
jgi:hypothetical protein